MTESETLNPPCSSRRALRCDETGILKMLSERQHLSPHDDVESALRRVADSVGLCRAASVRALDWLELDAATPLGRLRRTELAQLARCLYRFWRHESGLTVRFARRPADEPVDN